METHELVSVVALIFVVIGAVNWGVWGLFEYNLIGSLLGGFTAISRIIFVIVGIAGLYCISLFSPLHQHAREPRQL